MPFGTVGWTGPWMRQIVGSVTRRGNFVGKYGATLCNQWILFTIGTSHCAAVMFLLAQFLELQARPAGEACRLSARCG